MYNGIESDETLIDRVKNGEIEAFNPLVERYKLRLYKIMYRMVFNQDDAEDLVEEAFIKAFRAIKRFQSGRPFYPWVCRIAVNNAINFLKKKRKDKVQSIENIEYSLAAKKGNPVAMTREKILKEKIEKAMLLLKEEYRTVLILRIEESLSYDEISALLKIPRGTVMSRLARARQKLKEIFKKMEVQDL